MAILALNLLCRRLNRTLPGHVDLDEVNIVEFSLLELPDGLLTSLRAAHAKQHGTALAGEIAGNFQADTFVPARYQCDLLRGRHFD